MAHLHFWLVGILYKFLVHVFLDNIKPTFLTTNCVKNETVQCTHHMSVPSDSTLLRACGSWHVEWHAPTARGPHGRVRSSHPTLARPDTSDGHPNQLRSTLDEGNGRANSFLHCIVLVHSKAFVRNIFIQSAVLVRNDSFVKNCVEYQVEFYYSMSKEHVQRCWMWATVVGLYPSSCFVCHKL